MKLIFDSGDSESQMTLSSVTTVAAEIVNNDVVLTFSDPNGFEFETRIYKDEDEDIYYGDYEYEHNTHTLTLRDRDPEYYTVFIVWYNEDPVGESLSQTLEKTLGENYNNILTYDR